jgi:uncharacterized protein YndB with AHSA1/START domain
VAPAASDPAAADCEIVISRTIEGPRRLVFEAYTAVEHLEQWWGPNGFSVIVPPERIVLLHGDHPDDPNAFLSTITLAERGEDLTEVKTLGRPATYVESRRRR